MSELLLFELFNVSTIVYACNMFALNVVIRIRLDHKLLIWIAIYLLKIMTFKCKKHYNLRIKQKTRNMAILTKV